MYEIIGYLASTALAISLMQTNAIKFRWFNMSGSIFFIIYGLLIGAFPVLLANAILLCINIFQTYKLYSNKEQFDLVTVTTGGELIDKFLAFYQKDIVAYFPGFTFKTDEQTLCFVVLRNIVLANLFVAKLQSNGYAVVGINYTVPHFRDYKVGRFIFDKSKDYLLAKGVQHIVYEKVHNKHHVEFLMEMGFTQQTYQGSQCWMKSLV
jgi:hypothetical protein